MVSRRNIGARAAGKQRAADDAITVQDKKESGAAALERRRSRKVIRLMMGKLSDSARNPVAGRLQQVFDFTIRRR